MAVVINSVGQHAAIIECLHTLWLAGLLEGQNWLAA